MIDVALAFGCTRAHQPTHLTLTLALSFAMADTGLFGGDTSSSLGSDLNEISYSYTDSMFYFLFAALHVLLMAPCLVFSG